ncbi:ferredoxin [Aequitasia blattaphilus]|uniref:Late competence development ComFB family protein n=1 Tax=Aequitasia blattaphilus TaxID=2949332 RepID=A0ABT1EDI7_9FIRM|nr:late competence development ComFB family protein [Aequitasia blattaphilus]MCP1102532.1 late competence development ComFB family protein [Aequitasia blattaphilus]MCR8615172.1 late competence development ComFB family protein [Aequitasia blattaphilus]
MPKKTNKTDHVLNLLSTGDDGGQTEESVVTVEKESNQEDLAETIKNTLEQEASVEEAEVPKPTPKKSKITEKESVQEKEPKEKQEEYKVINVMDILVREKVRYYMQTMEMCNCSRCTVDVTALALTKLGAKYVVAKQEEVSPLLNFYSRKFEEEITIEVMKACSRVMESPHHVDK